MERQVCFQLSLSHSSPPRSCDRDPRVNVRASPLLHFSHLLYFLPLGRRRPLPFPLALRRRNRRGSVSVRLRLRAWHCWRRRRRRAVDGRGRLLAAQRLVLECRRERSRRSRRGSSQRHSGKAGKGGRVRKVPVVVHRPCRGFVGKGSEKKRRRRRRGGSEGGGEIDEKVDAAESEWNGSSRSLFLHIFSPFLRLFRNSSWTALWLAD